MSNLKQLSLAFHVYINDHKGALPPRDEFPDVLQPYVGNNKHLFYHPSRSDAVAGYPENIDYEYAAGLPEKLSEIEKTSRTPLMWEKRSFADDGARMVLFVDGHVEKVRTGAGSGN
jgi:prepilin-type processing-associated H-X9-DG protein